VELGKNYGGRKLDEIESMKNEKAVSPVIGVILMVVITVIIAALLAVFAFGIGSPTKAPETKLHYVMDVTGGTFTISNAGGDTLILKNEKITISNAVTDPTVATPLFDATMDTLGGVTATTLSAGKSIAGTPYGVADDVLRIQVLDLPTGQIISDTKVTAT
jgi:flagellin-like protein